MKTVIAGSLTKADEKALLTEIIDHCPDGYVKDILTDMRLEAEHAIDSDFGFVDLSMRRRENEEHREEMRKARETLTVLKAEIREKEDSIRRLDYGLNELRSTIKAFSRI